MELDRRSLAEPYQGGDRRGFEDRRKADRDALGVWRWDQEPDQSPLQPPPESRSGLAS